MKSTNDRVALSIFTLPTELLSDLEPVEVAKAALDNLEQQQKDEAQVTAEALARLQIQQERLANNINGAEGSAAEVAQLTCLTCRTSFNDRQEQKAHFNTDWHRYNIKRKLVLNVEPVTYDEFESLLADLSESISGSESEEEAEDEELKEDDDTIAAREERQTIDSLIRKEKVEQEQKEQLKNDAKQLVLPHMKKYSALFWFRRRQDKHATSSTHYGIYRRLLSASSSPLQCLQQLSQHKQWTIIMLGGGHFAACVIDVQATEKKRAQVKNPLEEGGVVKFITHRTFHRYTTRRKQGGSQSANDNAKGAANSAGAQIRRYNEQALQQEVREVLSHWQQHILNSQKVFVHAPSGNRKMVYNYEGAILDKIDDRLNTIPFATRRPTLNELKRVYFELTSLKTMNVDEQAIQQYKQQWIEKEEKAKKQLEKSMMGSSSSQNDRKETPQGTADSRLEKLLSLVKQNKTAVTLSYIQKNESKLPLSGLLPSDELGDKEDLYHYPTLLHLVASMGNGAGELVKELIINYDADPTIISQAGKTAYEVSKDKEVRNAFRRCMNDHPDKWDWLEKGRVPSPLTEKQEQEQLAKEKKRMEKERERKRLLEIEQARLDAEREAREQEEEQTSKRLQQQKSNQKSRLAPAAQKLGGKGSGASSSIHETLQMTPEARMRLEREKRARAAEERMKRLQQQ